MARIEVSRQAAADPAGVALLLSGPVGRELWPGETVYFGAPQRSGLGFAVDLTADDGGLRAAGHVGITPGDTGPGASEIRLVLVSPEAPAPVLANQARRFLDALADAAQERSSAA